MATRTASQAEDVEKVELVHHLGLRSGECARTPKWWYLHWYFELAKMITMKLSLADLSMNVG